MRDYSALEQQYGLPMGLLTAVERQESGGNASAVSSRGAIGNFQFMPATAKQYGIDPTDPDQSAIGAAKMYADLSKKYHGDVPSMVAGYNWGQGNVDRHGLDKAPKETKNYISSILSALNPISDAQADIGNMTDAVVDNSVRDHSNLSDEELDARIAALQTKSPSDHSNLSDEELDAKIAALQGGTPITPSAATEKDAGFFSRVGDDLSKRGNNWDEIQADYNAGKTSLPAATFQKLGLVGAGGLTDLVTEGGKSLLGAVLPDKNSEISKRAAQEVGGVARYIANTELGKKGIETAQDVGQAYQDAKEASPNAYRDIESGLNVVGALPLIKPAVVGANMARKGAAEVLGNSGAALTKAGELQAKELKDKFIHGLITPKETPTVKADQFSRSKESKWLKERVPEPSPQELEIINTVSALPVSKNKSLLANYRIIDDGITEEAKLLQGALEKKKFEFDKDELVGRFDGVVDEVGKMPAIISGNKQVWANQLIADAKAAIAKHPGTAAGILQARKDLDRVIDRYRPKAFDPITENALSEITPRVRGVLNDFIAEKVPSVEIKASLKKQHNLYRARDAIESKGGAEPKNMMARATEKIVNAVPGNDAVKKGLVLLGGATAAGTMPYLTATGAGLYGLGKAALSPTAKKVAGKTLEVTGDVLRGGKKVIPETKVNPKLLGYEPAKVTLVDEAGNLRPQTMQEYVAGEMARRKANATGMTPDILALHAKQAEADYMKQFGLSKMGEIAAKSGMPLSKVTGIPTMEYSVAKTNKMLNRSVWNKLEAAQKAKINADLERAWNEGVTPIEEMIEEADREAARLAAVKGEVKSTTEMGLKMKQATGKYAKGGPVKRNLTAEFLGRKYA